MFPGLIVLGEQAQEWPLFMPYQFFKHGDTVYMAKTQPAQYELAMQLLKAQCLYLGGGGR